MKKIILFLIPCLFITTVSHAQVKAKGGTWSPVGDTTISIAKNDPNGGDGVADGALWVNGNSVENGQGVTYTFEGKMKVNKDYKIDGYLYNFGKSFSNVTVSLFNKTTNTELAASQVYVLKNKEASQSDNEKVITLSYTASYEDKGGVLELRFIRSDDGKTARDFWIDNIKLNGDTIPLTSK